MEITETETELPLLRSNFENDLTHIVNTICDYPGHRDFVSLDLNIPRRYPIFNRFPVRKVTKRGVKGKPKSTKGYIWIDKDPVMLLFNKTITTSCHRLDNTSHAHRAGNVNHVYNPYVAPLFAAAGDPKDPANTIRAQSCETGCFFTDAGNNAYRIRKYQATALVFYMTDREGAPYMFLPRIYDSAAEYPWTVSIMRYVAAHARRIGFGFAVGSALKHADVRNEEESAIRRLVKTDSLYSGLERAQGVMLSTPPFVLPSYEKEVIPFYLDSEMEMQRYRGRYDSESGLSSETVNDDGLMPVVVCVDDARVVFKPDIDKKSDVRVNFYDIGNNVEFISPSNLQEGFALRCNDCGRRIPKNEAGSFFNDDAEEICDSCSCFYASCVKCDEYMHTNNGARTGGDDEVFYCWRCASLYLSLCESCGDRFPKEETETVQNSASSDTLTYCASCIKHYSCMCQSCNRRLRSRDMFLSNKCFGCLSKPLISRREGVI